MIMFYVDIYLECRGAYINHFSALPKSLNIGNSSCMLIYGTEISTMNNDHVHINGRES